MIRVMRSRHFPSFASLAQELQRSANKTFLHHWQDPSYRNSLPPAFQAGLPPGWDIPGRSGTSEVPKYLYRGEPGIFPTTLSSRGRLAKVARFGQVELTLLDRLTQMATEVTNGRIADQFRAVGWPQHYGFPTAYLDLTSDPSVALHFAASADTDPPPQKRVLYRIDLEAIERKVYGLAGKSTPLALAGIDHLYFTRAARQSAFVICARKKVLDFDLQRSHHLWWHIEKFTVDAVDAEHFLRPELLTAQDDVLAAWPLAFVRALKIVARGALTRTLAEWICARIPLYEWTPVQVDYDGKGRGGRFGLISPSEAQQRDGRDYRADKQKVIEELISPEIPTPNGIIFGTPTGGEPGKVEWLEPGSECEVQWRHGFEGIDGALTDEYWQYAPKTFKRVILR